MRSLFPCSACSLLVCCAPLLFASAGRSAEPARLYSMLRCISTLLESGNHYSKMFELKNATTGEPMFEQIAITLVCGATTPRPRHSPMCTDNAQPMRIVRR